MEERNLPPRPVLGADTEVVLDDVIFGKPADADAARADARAPVRPPARRDHRGRAALEGRRRRRAVGLARHAAQARLPARSSATSRRGEPFDKAGGYAIQGRAAAFITRLEGSYSGVMGLPLAETAALLARIGRARAITIGNQAACSTRAAQVAPQ